MDGIDGMFTISCKIISTHKLKKQQTWTKQYLSPSKLLSYCAARVNGTFFGALYHPPRPLYNPTALLDHIETCVEEITRDFPTATIVLGGDINQLTDEDVIERTGFSQIILQPTRGTRVLDRIFVSSPIIYSGSGSQLAGEERPQGDCCVCKCRMPGLTFNC